jgi:hypothetical protein
MTSSFCSIRTSSRPNHAENFNNKRRAPALGPEAPDFALSDLQNKPVRLSELKGKVVLMDFTFVSRLAQNPNVSEQTIRALAGHVSRQMLEHYSHIRSQAKLAAIRCLEDQAGAPALEAMGHSIGVLGTGLKMKADRMHLTR